MPFVALTGSESELARPGQGRNLTLNRMFSRQTADAGFYTADAEITRIILR